MPVTSKGVGMGKGHPPEFRRRVLDLVSGKSLTDVARDFGVSGQAIYNWRKQDRIDREETPGLRSSELAELQAARRRIHDLEVFHNRQRRHSSLGMLTPIEFEKIHANRLVVA